MKRKPKLIDLKSGDRIRIDVARYKLVKNSFSVANQIVIYDVVEKRKPKQPEIER